jgi:hypothetical protein
MPEKTLYLYEEKEYECPTLDGEVVTVKLWLAPGNYPLVIMPDILAKELEPAHFNQLLSQVVNSFRLDCKQLSWIGLVELPPPLPLPQAVDFSDWVATDVEAVEDFAPLQENATEISSPAEPGYAYVLFNLHWSYLGEPDSPEADVSWEGSYQPLDRLILAALLERLGLLLKLP